MFKDSSEGQTQSDQAPRKMRLVVEVQARSTVGLCLCDDELRIVVEHGRPHGIRDRSGYLFFFRDIHKYQGQDERYRSEIEQQFALADFLLAALLGHNADVTGAEPVGEASELT